MVSDVLFRLHSANGGYVGEIQLNRVAQLNALTPTMVISIRDQLLAWAVRSDLKAVVIRSCSDKAFCAGGDVRQLSQYAQKDVHQALNFLEPEYQINELISRYPVPYLAFLDGLTLGGGVGLSIHGRYRIATERTKWAMPETAIGFLTDIGASYFLSRCPYDIGFYLALTGYRVNARDGHRLGLHSHTVPSDRLAHLWEEVLAWDPQRHAIDTLLARYHTELPLEQPLWDARTDIQSWCAGDSWREVSQRIQSLDHLLAKVLRDALSQYSPTSLAITWALLHRGKTEPLWDCLKREFNVAHHLLLQSDFHEGVRARLIDKDQNPQWTPCVHELLSDIELNYFNPINGRVLKGPLSTSAK